MTVNKSQGQSLEHVGVDLRTYAFTHGQLYVELSRVTSVSGLVVLQLESQHRSTSNIVYLEILLQLGFLQLQYIISTTLLFSII